MSLSQIIISYQNYFKSPKKASATHFMKSFLFFMSFWMVGKAAAPPKPKRIAENPLLNDANVGFVNVGFKGKTLTSPLSRIISIVTVRQVTKTPIVARKVTFLYSNFIFTDEDADELYRFVKLLMKLLIKKNV